MLRKCVLGLFIASCGAAAVIAWRGESTAQPPRNVPDQPNDPLVPMNGNGKALKPSNPLPIAQVVLFNSGVGYFQRSGEVEGEARVDLQFSAANINDLIKSLVIEDQKGKPLPLRYDSQEPIEKTLKSFAIDLSTNPSFGQILNQARGEKVEVTMQNTVAGQPGTMTGVIVGMETQQRPGAGPGQPAGEIELLNLSCAEGLRCVPLRDVQRLRFLNPMIESELRRALEVVAVGHDSLKKAVRLDFRGEGKRQVKVGYVVENPIWKTSYRIVLNGKEKPRLLGWASVENTSDEDWNNVKLTLVSGRPISFQMDLYPPLYIPRPVVEPELFASLRPPTYGGPISGWINNPGFGMLGGANTFPFNIPDGTNNTLMQNGRAGQPMNPMGTPQQQFAGFSQGQNVNLGNLGGQQQIGGAFQGVGGGFGQTGMQGQFGNNFNRFQQQAILNLANGTDNNGRLNYQDWQARRNNEKQNKDQQQKSAQQIGQIITNVDPNLVEAALTAEELGNTARYSIDETVTLPRQQSAMLPILDQPVEATRVSIYNEHVQAKHPLFGLKIKNTSKQALMQGPIAIYDDGQYAGDARVLDLQPGEERFVSYAVDTGMEIKPFDKVAPGPEMTASVQNGQLSVQYKLRQTRTYVIKNRSPEERQVVIEQPVRDGWKLVVPEKPSERTRDLYRFTVVVKPGETAKYEVAEELPRVDPFAVTKQTDWTGFATSLGLDVWTDTQRTPEGEFTLQVVRGGSPGKAGVKPAANPAAQAPNAGWKGVEGQPAAGPDTLEVIHKDRRTTTYFFRNRVKEERTVWLEHFVPHERKLLGDAQPVAENAQRYRFKLALPPDKTISYTVSEELKEAQAEPFPLKLVEGTPPPRPNTDDLPQMRYVTELGFEVWLSHTRHADELKNVRFVKGQVQSVTNEKEMLTYHVRNRSERDRTFVVEHVVRQDWSLAGDAKPVAGAGQRYHFPLKTAKDEVAKQHVTEEHKVMRQEELAKIGDERLKEMVASNVVTAKMKEQLQKGAGMIAALAQTQAALTELRSQAKEITTEQERLRVNIEKLPQDAPLYNRYLGKLDQQETALEKVQGETSQKVEAEKRQKKELEGFLDNLNVE
jgi:hypothetical protein